MTDAGAAAYAPLTPPTATQTLSLDAPSAVAAVPTTAAP